GPKARRCFCVWRRRMKTAKNASRQKKPGTEKRMSWPGSCPLLDQLEDGKVDTPFERNAAFIEKMAIRRLDAGDDRFINDDRRGTGKQRAIVLARRGDAISDRVHPQPLDDAGRNLHVQVSRFQTG